MRYAVCPVSPGNLWWEGFRQQHVKDLSRPIKRYTRSHDARRYAHKYADHYQYGLAIVDTKRELVDWGEAYRPSWTRPGVLT